MTATLTYTLILATIFIGKKWLLQNSIILGLKKIL